MGQYFGFGVHNSGNEQAIQPAMGGDLDLSSGGWLLSATARFAPRQEII
jgi:hypothetical protein